MFANIQTKKKQRRKKNNFGRSFTKYLLHFYIPDETDHTCSADDFPFNRMQLFTQCAIEDVNIVESSSGERRIAVSSSI